MQSGNEEWKEVPDLPQYQVSNFGRLRGPRGPRKLNPDKWGYPIAVICTPQGKNIVLRIHRLVCTLWHGPPFEGAQALHKDDVKTNNHENNLYWGTHQDNMDDQRKNKVHASRFMTVPALREELNARIR